MYKIMIVEDDTVISNQISKFLLSWDYYVEIANDFRNIMNEFSSIDPDIVFMDLTLPYKNGYYWCEQIRKVSRVPIMFISSASDNMNIVMAMNAGADDYISKPFDLNVLVAKLQAMLRRTYDFASQVNYLEHEGVRLNCSNSIVTYKDKCIELTKNESKILKILLEHKGEIVERDTLMEYLWQTDCYVDDNTLSVNVNRLRKTLEQIDVHDFIKTKKGIGYII
ncbi:MAG: response regulator transcription factor [Erysipelotrichaceae bacterium]|nr:response regulator transcription factor [Erysipelotrichaceae bacterium]